ncbi:hypothetical protein P3X46_022056 [Hevea brasiliensis]|uniref:Pentacotripeptide-repeat region of PRORP domain-containing protein n=1 Tax=Hevea brasiliensis TaxID=3981 RepID=A0ABQ9LHG9_HEVBR|nr:pentatricopeptide repeat-containing protein At1g52640, mitochondrial-like [Hevea brasiliensis]KAJ9167401.1 hypothetical protein P3X46_022056 [Hevea brasiliensis]
MKSSKLFKSNLRYLSNPHLSICSISSHYSLTHFLLSFPTKTLVSPRLFGSPICNSSFRNLTLDHPYSSISTIGSFLFCSETYPFHHSLCLFKYNGCRNLSPFSSYGSPSLSPMTYSYLQSSNCFGFTRCNCRYKDYTKQNFNLYLFKSRAHYCFRFYSVSSIDASQCKKLHTDELRPIATPKQVFKIIGLLRSNEDDLESKLCKLNLRLSITSVARVLRALSSKKRSALHFFQWIRHWQPELECNSDICSLIIDNCGRLGDYDAMQCLLNDFSLKSLSLTNKAFGFLTSTGTTETLLRKSTQRVIDILCEVGGTCYGTGVYSLIEMFSDWGSFDMAKFVIEKTERRLSFYNVLIKEMCQRCDFKGARDMMDEMREAGCNPSSQTYNYIISSLLKNGKNADAYELFQKMKESNCSPDALTFEIFIYNSCCGGKLDVAFEFLDEEVASGLEPRLLTHAAFIKGLFNSQQYEEAYKYVLSSDDKCSSSVNYSLLAGLNQKRGNVGAAEYILSEMIKKGLRPHYNVYMRVLKQIQRSGKKTSAADLQEKFLQLELRA